MYFHIQVLSGIAQRFKVNKIDLLFVPVDIKDHFSFQISQKMKLTNQRQFSMVYTLIDHKMFKTQVEPRATDEWFHCQVLNILWHHFIVYNYKSLYNEQCKTHILIGLEECVIRV